MPFKKGDPKPANGGRQKGTPNKDILGLEERAAALGLDVFATLVHFAAGNWQALGYDSDCYHMEKPDGAIKLGYTITPEMRLKATNELMQYIYPKKKAVEISAADGFKIIVEDYSTKKDE